MSAFIQKLKRVKFKEFVQIWKLPVSLICVPFYRIKHKNLWIVCEDRNEARDNGYWFFKYVCEKHPEQECVYAISPKSPDFKKISSIGPTVKFGSLKHWIVYLSSRKKIASQKAGNPNAAIFYFLEVYGLLKDKRCFLGHGITINDAKWLYYDVTKMSKFVCGAKPEYDFVNERFGYPSSNVIYTGLARFDGLHDFQVDKNMILIMPSWREWIADEDSRLLEFEGTTNIAETNYFVKWCEFLNSPVLKELSDKYGVKFLFFPHRNMQKYIELFPKSRDYLEVADARKYDVQDLMKRAPMMITDYSSVFMDMVYMKKPVLFYQFDYERFRSCQYGEGYFDYRNNPFSKSFDELDGLLGELETQISNRFSVSEEYEKAHKSFFQLYDCYNCQRIYDEVVGK